MAARSSAAGEIEALSGECRALAMALQAQAMGYGWLRRDDADDLHAVANRLVALADRLIALRQDGDVKGLWGAIKSAGRWGALALVPGIAIGVASGMGQAAGEHMLGTFIDGDQSEQVQDLGQRIYDRSCYLLTLPAESLLPARAQDQVWEGSVKDVRVDAQPAEWSTDEPADGVRVTDEGIEVTEGGINVGPARTDVPSPGVTGEGRATEAPDVAEAHGDVGTEQGASVSLGVNAGLASASGTAHDPSAQAVDLQVDDVVSRSTISQEPADPIGITDTVDVDVERGRVAGDEGATPSEDHPTTGLLSAGFSAAASTTRGGQPQQVPVDAATLNLEGVDVEARTDEPPEEGG